ncbi:hypothetical protein SAMN05216516_102277 [Izhakiella capsodis]|uniref:Uncharacterized protein n=1 Tax=Izhakiella capsodis TaxID=1367852 RepID=A0A1I4W480_9GAMM|nr:hypothetical protein [Izhakiella capsodis]SFN08313.1 hypothetical protein SAMN05216516_102277 [Izhakiella capsodis]
MNNIFNKGISLLEVSFVMLLSILTCTSGCLYYRAVIFEIKNEKTFTIVSELQTALASYIKLNSDNIKYQFYNNGGNPWELNDSDLLKYLNSNTNILSKNGFHDGYGNTLVVLITVYKNNSYGLIVDDGNITEIPADFLSRLKVSIGTSAGNYNKVTSSLDGIGASWTFPITPWSVPDVNIKNAPFVALNYNNALKIEAFSNLDASKSEAGTVTDITGQNTIHWNPVFKEDRLSFSYTKNPSIDYIQYALSSPSQGIINQGNLFSDTLLINPSPQWIINGAQLILSIKGHYKVSNTFTNSMTIDILIDKKNAQKFYGSILSGADVSYSVHALKMAGEDQFIPSSCKTPADILLAKIFQVTLRSNNTYSGHFLIPLRLKITYSNPYSSNNPLYYFYANSPSDVYYEDPDILTQSADISSGECSITSSAERYSVLTLYINSLSNNSYSKVTSKEISWNITGQAQSDIRWNSDSGG